MSVVTTGPLNPAQLSTALGGAVLRVEGDPTQPGAKVSSEHWSDAQIAAALAGLAYDPHAGEDPRITAVRAARPNVVTAAGAGGAGAQIAAALLHVIDLLLAS